MLRCALPCRDYCTHERALLLTVSGLAATISPKREQCSQTREGEAHVVARDRRSRPGRLHHRDAAGRAGRAGPPRQSTGQRPDASRDRAGGRRRDRRRAAQRPGRWRRRALQLRQPALPPLAHRLAAAGLLAADRGRAERSGAGVREQPLRVRAGGRADHQAGRLRTAEVRASDYIEANSIFSFTLTKPLLAGRRAYVPAELDVPHSWTSTVDVARTLVTVATDERAWGTAWLVPTNLPLTIRTPTTRFTKVAGAPAPKLAAVPYPVLWTGGLFSPMLRELRITRYQWNGPFVIDSTFTERTFGLAPIELDTALASVAARATQRAAT